MESSARDRDFTRRRNRAFALLAKAGIDADGWSPPPFRWLWALDFAVRPPHFQSFLSNTLIFGATLAIPCILVMGLHDLDQWIMTGVALAVVMGAIAAVAYQSDREEHGLPRWDEIDDLGEDAHTESSTAGPSP